MDAGVLARIARETGQQVEANIPHAQDHATREALITLSAAFYTFAELIARGPVRPND